MLLIVLPMLFQAATADVQAQTAAPAAAATEAAKPAEPEVVCKMEAVTGSRSSKVKVCRDKDYKKNSDRSRAEFDQLQRHSGANIPPLGGP